jgi:hypothetical protein
MSPVENMAYTYSRVPAYKTQNTSRWEGVPMQAKHKNTGRWEGVKSRLSHFQVYADHTSRQKNAAQAARRLVK